MTRLVHRAVRDALSAGCIASGWRHRCVVRYGRAGRVLCAFSHNPTRAVMEGTVGWLKGNGFRFIAQQELVQALRGQGTLPARSVWLSFDDCWCDNLSNVLPVLEREKIPATFFVAPGATELGFEWTAVGMRAGDRSRRELLAMPNLARQEHIRRLIDAGLGVPRRLMTADDIARLSRNPLLSFENHTASHAVATSCSAEELLQEIASADRMIAAWTGKKTSLVCYPFGMWSKAHDAAVTRAGWITVSSDPGCLTIGPERVRTSPLPRNLFYDNRSLAENSCRLVGAWKQVRSHNRAD